MLLGAAFLGVRYWILPNINQWREPLQRELSQHLPVQVELGEIQAQWRGRHPRISLRNTTLRDTDGSPLLKIPTLDVVLAWSSFFGGQPQFLVLQADGLAVSLKRDVQDRIFLVGYDVAPGERSENGHGEGDGFVHWLAQQGDIRLNNARIVWHDESRSAPPLELQDVAMAIRQEDGEHIFSVLARPPGFMGDGFKLQGRVHADLQAGEDFSLSALSGLLHVDVENMRPTGWKPWVDVHSALERGRVSWRAWQELHKGEPGHHTSQVRVEGGVWNPEAGIGVRARAAELFLSGDWLALQQLLAGGLPPEDADVALDASPVRIAASLSGVKVEAGEVLQDVLSFNGLALAATMSRDTDAGLHIDFDRAQIRNADIDLEFSGNWREQGGAAGLIDVSGQFGRAELSAIHRYLPDVVNEEAREWLKSGLPEGRLVNGSVHLQGDLAHFPFGDEPERGDFLIAAQVENAVIDYAPASAVGEPGWPRLEALKGHARLHKVDLSIHADTVQMRPAGETIALRDVDARIPSIEHDSVLSVEGLGEAPAKAFLSLLNHSPLKSLLDGMFEQARGQGDWRVPIALTIPLMNPEDTTVRGEVIFNKGGLQLTPQIPALTDMQGSLSFSDTGVIVQDLKARSLGGAVRLTGGIGEKQKALTFEGTLTGKALDDYLKGQLRGKLDGKTSYQIAVQSGGDGAYAVTFTSNLQGLALGLPAPFDKKTDQSWPLRAKWTHTGSKGKDSILEAKLEKLLDLSLLHRNGTEEGKPFFYAGAIGVGSKAVAPSNGLALDIRTTNIDLDEWRSLSSELAEEGQAEAKRAPLPPVRDLRLQADSATVLGMDLDRLTFTARQPEGQRWRVDVSSSETAGTLYWRESSGKIEGDVEAHFQRLAIGKARTGGNNENDEEPSYNLADNLDFPAIRLKVDKLRLYGRDVGGLSVVGLNDARERRWKLEQLELNSPHASLKGNGIWQLQGPSRGLRLDARVLVDDLGSYLDQAGFKDLVEGGHGQVDGVVEWRDIPWRFELAGLQGDLRVDLAQGRFVDVGSRSARLLELLSLQSVKRLASLNWNPAGLTKQGFPFDTLQAHVTVQNGVMHSENYRVTGPVASIAIAGDVNLPKETLDLYAVVVPNLDVSGAAIAAGIAVNPIVGVGAFLTQWLLKNPMSKAMSAEYRVTGGFDAPEIKEVETGGEKGTLPGHPVSESGRGQ